MSKVDVCNWVTEPAGEGDIWYIRTSCRSGFPLYDNNDKINLEYFRIMSKGEAIINEIHGIEVPMGKQCKCGLYMNLYVIEESKHLNPRMIGWIEQEGGDETNR